MKTDVSVDETENKKRGSRKLSKAGFLRRKKGRYLANQLKKRGEAEVNNFRITECT